MLTSGRNLVTIPISLYSKAMEIISLNLSRNLSLDVPRDFVQSCKHLRDIKFNNNEARKLPPSLSRANKLTYLDVANNRIEQLEHAELNALTGMIKMNLANNRLKHLPSYFGAYQSLRTLNISSNFIDKFPTFLCGLPSLVDLDLSFNAIATIPQEIGSLRNLEKLLITNNRQTNTRCTCHVWTTCQSSRTRHQVQWHLQHRHHLGAAQTRNSFCGSQLRLCFRWAV
ncbi:hypothetical protein NXS19_001526 [Fusarium pseudograminearum]|nr:hypothetical protein NXS19_001526 [Fusarium pseudograminearum]